MACIVPDGAMAHELQRWESASGQQEAPAPLSSAEKSAQLSGAVCMPLGESDSIKLALEITK